MAETDMEASSFAMEAAPVDGQPAMLGGGGYGGAMTQSRMGRSGGVPRSIASPNLGMQRGFGFVEPANANRYRRVAASGFKSVADQPLSTFSIDVDTASYTKARDELLRQNRLPSPDGIRIEEFLNYFQYDLPTPTVDDEHPLSIDTELTVCPWQPNERLVRVAVASRRPTGKRPACNLVFLIDTSGSMNASNKLPLAVEGLKKLTGKLDENDRVAIVVYASATGLVLDSTPGDKTKKIRKALKRLSAGGSTNGGAGIQLAYQTARDHFIEGGVNRVMLCTDGDFNVGTTSDTSLVDLVKRESAGGIELTVLGFGSGNLNDAMLEQISGDGNGTYHFIDSQSEATKVLARQADSTLVTIARDVKIQVEFNPARVSDYRLIGYENRALAAEDFNDDKKDAGEIGVGHQVTALYQVRVADDAIESNVDPLKYQPESASVIVDDENKDDVIGDEWMTVKLRYQRPTGQPGANDGSVKIESIVEGDAKAFDDSTSSQKLATTLAAFAMRLRGDRDDADKRWGWSKITKTAKSIELASQNGELDELRRMIQTAKQLSR